MTLFELSPTPGGNIAVRDVAEVAVAVLLGLLAWQGKRLTAKVDTTVATLDKWGGILFGPTGSGGMYGEVQSLRQRLDPSHDSDPEHFSSYDRRRSTRRREDVEHEKDRLRSLVPNEGTG